uniref:oleoyl-[acyl-carrier-protein] hydrolase n=1 Tax=Timema bartmani TaxID=61472 RepID=A0A7R9I585_9NEOP|nr:unnamed protein product [Timema bartmani]
MANALVVLSSTAEDGDIEVRISNDAISLHNLDVASRSLDSLSHFVSLMDKSGEDVSKERFKAGLPILDVQWIDSQKSVNIQPILKVMDRLLSSRSPPFITISLEDKLIKYANEVSRFNEIGRFLPSNLEELEGVGFHFLSKAKSPLVVIPSLSPGIGRVPEVPPIFIVPGIQDQIKKVLETLTKKILYPTICINLQDYNISLSNSARSIVKVLDVCVLVFQAELPRSLGLLLMRIGRLSLVIIGVTESAIRICCTNAINITTEGTVPSTSDGRRSSFEELSPIPIRATSTAQTKKRKTGPYNLVGVSWGGILALELARELQSQDQKIQLFILDGAPDTTQSIAKLLGTGDELQCNLITKLLDIESNKVHEELTDLNDWKSRVDFALNEMVNLSPKRKRLLESGLESTYLRINKFLSYKPPEKLLSGDVHLIRPEGALQEDNCELQKESFVSARTTPQATLRTLVHKSQLTTSIYFCACAYPHSRTIRMRTQPPTIFCVLVLLEALYLEDHHVVS